MTHRLLALVPVCFLAASSFAQIQQTGLSAQRQPFTLSMSAVYQGYSGSTEISQFSLPISFYAPVGRNFGLALSTSPASTSADAPESELAGISGTSDTQLQLSYGRRLTGSTIVFSVSANLPSGQTGLSADKKPTAILMSQNYLNLNLSTYGQGFNLAPGVTWAYSVNDDVAVGVGASYQYKGAFNPWADVDSYDPGNEILLTAGVDYRIDESLSVSGDLSYAAYGTDYLDGKESFDAGNRITFIAQALKLMGHHRGRLIALYRARGKNDVLVSGQLVTQDERTLPNQFEIVGMTDLRVSSRAMVGLRIGASLFDAVGDTEARRLLEFGVVPQMRISDSLSLVSRFIYTHGLGSELTGLEIGAGFVTRF